MNVCIWEYMDVFLKKLFNLIRYSSELVLHILSLFLYREYLRYKII